jgi:hypothetical protein
MVNSHLKNAEGPISKKLKRGNASKKSKTTSKKEKARRKEVNRTRRKQLRKINI